MEPVFVGRSSRDDVVEVGETIGLFAELSGVTPDIMFVAMAVMAFLMLWLAAWVVVSLFRALVQPRPHAEHCHECTVDTRRAFGRGMKAIGTALVWPFKMTFGVRNASR